MLDGVETLADVPPETRARLCEQGRLETLTAGQELTSFALALLIEGEAALSATLANERVDECAVRLDTRTLVPTRGTFGAAVAVRVVAGPNGAKVASWDQLTIDETLRTSPWVVEELAGTADRLQALAGATLGPLGSVEESIRVKVFEKLSVLVARPGDMVEAVVSPAAIVCAGALDLEGGVVVPAGQVLFPRAGVERAVASASGAILLTGTSAVLDELAVTAPNVAALFASRA